MGAIYLDSGFNLTRLWEMMQFLLDPVISISKLQFNPLRDLTELCQSYNWKIQCSSLKKDGKYTVSAKVDEGISASASGTSTSKKAAKRMAAKQLLEYLKVIIHKRNLFILIPLCFQLYSHPNFFQSWNLFLRQLYYHVTTKG